jgi:hypothetical protein
MLIIITMSMIKVINRTSSVLFGVRLSTMLSKSRTDDGGNDGDDDDDDGGDEGDDGGGNDAEDDTSVATESIATSTE